MVFPVVIAIVWWGIVGIRLIVEIQTPTVLNAFALFFTLIAALAWTWLAFNER